MWSVRAATRACLRVCGLGSRPGQRGGDRCDGAERRASSEENQGLGETSLGYAE